MSEIGPKKSKIRDFLNDDALKLSAEGDVVRFTGIVSITGGNKANSHKSYADGITSYLKETIGLLSVKAIMVVGKGSDAITHVDMSRDDFERFINHEHLPAPLQNSIKEKMEAADIPRKETDASTAALGDVVKPPKGNGKTPD